MIPVSGSEPVKAYRIMRGKHGLVLDQYLSVWGGEFWKPEMSAPGNCCSQKYDGHLCHRAVKLSVVLFFSSAIPQPFGQSAGHGGTGAANRPGDHWGNGPGHPHKLLRHAHLREPQDGRHQELMAGRPTRGEAVQCGLQVRGPNQKTQQGSRSSHTLMSRA